MFFSITRLRLKFWLLSTHRLHTFRRNAKAVVNIFDTRMVTCYATSELAGVSVQNAQMVLHRLSNKQLFTFHVFHGLSQIYPPLCWNDPMRHRLGLVAMCDIAMGRPSTSVDRVDYCLQRHEIIEKYLNADEVYMSVFLVYAEPKFNVCQHIL